MLLLTLPLSTFYGVNGGPGGVDGQRIQGLYANSYNVGPYVQKNLSSMYNKSTDLKLADWNIKKLEKSWKTW